MSKIQFLFQFARQDIFGGRLLMWFETIEQVNKYSGNM